MTITEPGVYELDDETYHDDPVPGGSLSNSDAKLLLPPSCPAKYRYVRDHGRPPKRAFDVGHAAHKLVLGAGPELVAVAGTGKAGPDTWATNVDKERVAAVRERGAVPLHPAEMVLVQAMADALRAHPIAAALFDPEHGQPEQSLFWVDQETGVWCRARPDWLPAPRAGRMVVPDYKTCDRADLDSLSKDIYKHAYYRQAPWYLDGVRALGLADDDAAFVFVCQEKEPPYLINIIEPDAEALAAGRARNRHAREVYRDCAATGIWPGYSSDIELISLPRWATYQLEESAA